MSFTGVVNGSSAILTIGQYESASIRIGTKELFNVAGNDIKSQKYGGYDY